MKACFIVLLCLSSVSVFSQIDTAKYNKWPIKYLIFHLDSLVKLRNIKSPYIPQLNLWDSLARAMEQKLKIAKSNKNYTDIDYFEREFSMCSNQFYYLFKEMNQKVKEFQDTTIYKP